MSRWQKNGIMLEGEPNFARPVTYQQTGMIPQAFFFWVAHGPDVTRMTGLDRSKVIVATYDGIPCPGARLNFLCKEPVSPDRARADADGAFRRADLDGFLLGQEGGWAGRYQAGRPRDGWAPPEQVEACLAYCWQSAQRHGKILGVGVQMVQPVPGSVFDRYSHFAVLYNYDYNADTMRDLAKQLRAGGYTKPILIMGEGRDDRANMWLDTHPEQVHRLYGYGYCFGAYRPDQGYINNGGNRNYIGVINSLVVPPPGSGWLLQRFIRWLVELIRGR